MESAAAHESSNGCWQARNRVGGTTLPCNYPTRPRGVNGTMAAMQVRAEPRADRALTGADRVLTVC